MKRTRPALAPLLLALSLALLVSLLAVTSAVGRAPNPRARAASSFLTGIGDQHTEMFTNPLWQQLHTKIARYIVPYDAAVRPFSLTLATQWIRAAEAAHQQVLVAFYHSEYTPTKMPSIATYQKDVQKFIKLFPKVKQYQSWNEANRGNVKGSFASPSATADAKYYQALLRVCTGCTVIGLDVLDAANISPTLKYISEFKREISRLETVKPKISGLHNYSDVNRLETKRTKALTKALGGQVWLTETGGLVKFEPGFSNHNGAGLTRAAKALKLMFSIANSQPQIKRLYIFDWTGGTSSTRFDAGLMNAKYQPRAGYIVVCRQLHAAKCNQTVAKN
jgi:Glycosyl hydrolase catalytic core